MRKLIFLAALVAVQWVAGCNTTDSGNDGGANDTVVVMKDGPPEMRETVNPEPVQQYVYKLPGNLNNHEFSVKLYETEKRFTYRADLRYEEVTGSDDINFPNLLQEPQPVLKKGEDDMSCIIGFIDNKGEFREYKKVSVDNGDLRIRTLRYYGVSTTTPEIQEEK